MTCPNCGTKLTEGATICENCGAGVSAATEPEQVTYTAPVYEAPKNVEITKDNLPAKFEPMGAWSYFWHQILFCIPVVGFVFLIVFAVGGTRNINKRNFARSYFCGLIIVAIIVVIFCVLAALGVGGGLALSELGY